MKPLISICFWLFSLSTVSAQGGYPWVSFYNSDETLAGFKDAKGVVKIPPKFRPFTLQSKFYNIIGVVEQVGESSQDYYLTKSGRKLAIDSVYYWDFTAILSRKGLSVFVTTRRTRLVC